MAKKVLITGITGFAGSFLAEELLMRENYEIYGTHQGSTSSRNLSHIQDQVELITIDLMDFTKVKEMVASIQPDLVFHLAAIAAPSVSFDNPSETLTNNTTVQIHILEALREHPARVLVVSSGDVYGKVAEENLPISENVPLNPCNTYSVSKIAQDYLGLQYFNTYQLPVVRVRPFNHIGPRQRDSFAVASFAKRIADIEKGKSEQILKVGNLDSKRDFTDVRDMVSAYVAALERGEPGEVYNIGSGTSYAMKEIVDRLLHLSTADIQIEEDLSLLRPSDVPVLVSDSHKFRQLTGWSPLISLDQTLQDVLTYWRLQE